MHIDEQLNILSHILSNFRVQSVSLTAQAPSDFTAIDTTVTFQTTETTKTVTVPIAGDTRIENDEMFVLNLSTDDDQVRINVDEMRITILDNDGT